MSPSVPPPENYRNYLRVLADAYLGRGGGAKLDASDVVQMTLLKAHQAREQFRGATSGEMACWLRQILARTVADQLKALARDKRDAELERSIHSVNESSCRLENWLAAEQSTPSHKIHRDEQLRSLADALMQLPEEQRLAVTLKHCQGLSVTQIAEQMSRTPASVAGLLRRGLQQLRHVLRADETEPQT